MTSLRPLQLGLGLLALSPLALAQTDLRVQVVDEARLPLAGLDVFVYDADGSALFSALDAPGHFDATATGDFVSVHLPEFGAVLEVPLSGIPGAEVTVRVSSAKGVAGLAGVKPFTPGVAFGTPGAPANDDCPNALPIDVGDTAFSTIGATTDSTIGSNNNDIWYAYTAPANGVVSFSTCNQADFDTDLVLLTAASTCGSQFALAIVDDTTGCGGNTTVLNAGVEAGQTYLLSLGGFGATDAGTGTLTVSFTGAAANDDCSGAEALALGSSTTFSNVTATTSPTDPEFSCIFNGPAQGFGSLWYSFVADGDSALLTTENSQGSNDTVVGVYSGGCDGLVEVACGEDIDLAGGNFLTQVIATGLTAGDEYLIQVCTFSEAAAGEITLDLNSGPFSQSYNGSGINTATLELRGPALVGETAEFSVNPGAGMTVLGISNTAAQFVLDPFGEILISTSFQGTSESMNGRHLIPVSDNPALIGRTFFAQALVVDSEEVTNGVEFELGGF